MHMARRGSARLCIRYTFYSLKRFLYKGWDVFLLVFELAAAVDLRAERVRFCSKAAVGHFAVRGFFNGPHQIRRGLRTAGGSCRCASSPRAGSDLFNTVGHAIELEEPGRRL